MSLQLPRADNLRIIRALCGHLAGLPGQRAALHSIHHWLESVANEVYSHSWKRSRVYHYTSAAQDLTLIDKADTHTVVLSPLGQALAETCSSADALRSPLHGAEKAILARAMLESAAARQYLALYMPDGLPPSSVADFKRRGRSLTMVCSSPDHYDLRTAADATVVLRGADKKAYAWTLYNWVRSLDLADDMYRETPASFLLKERTVRVFYAIRQPALDAPALQSILLVDAELSNQRLRTYYIPELVLRVATSHGVPKLTVIRALVDLHQSDPVQFQLEMMSSLRSDARCKAFYHYENFPTVHGVLRSHLCMSMPERTPETL
jgi:hypothetical protein